MTPSSPTLSFRGSRCAFGLLALLGFFLSPVAVRYSIAEETNGWPFQTYTSVKGYCYDYTQEDTPTFMPEGRFHEGLITPAGVRLSGAQAEDLMNAITGSHPALDDMSCYRPHHAFVFYNEKDEPVGVVEVCFACSTFRSYPEEGLARRWDLKAIKALCHDLALPLHGDNAGYTAEWRKAKGKRP